LRGAKSWRDVRTAQNFRIKAGFLHLADHFAVSNEDDFRIRPGRIGSSKRQRTKSAIAQALIAARLAGGVISKQGRIVSPRASTFGRGRVAAVRAGYRFGGKTRGAVIKARVVRMTARGSLGAHLSYLQRDGVTRDGERGQLSSADGQEVDLETFAKRCENDRHHFRFIVSPDDALEMADLKSFTRELMGQMEKDFGTRLDWAAVDHWNTEHPHIHLIVRGVGDDSKDLVISRDYIREGMRGRARELITRELDSRTEIDIRRSLERQVDAERWSEIDRSLARSVQRDGLIDMAPAAGSQPDVAHALKMGRLRKLERLDLAREIGLGNGLYLGMPNSSCGRWVVAATLSNACTMRWLTADLIVGRQATILMPSRKDQ
jgi:hypothetical protein